jgi:tRNA(Ile)-lysidine synthase
LPKQTILDPGLRRDERRAGPSLEASFGSVLDQRLDPASPRPLAVGLSGGSDSLALLLLTRAWAGAHGRRLVALTVDHGLQVASRAWAGRCAELCVRLDITHRTLTWTDPKPAAGLPAAARAARHALLAEAARQAGASVLLLGHTAEDLIESAAMRQDGSTVPDAKAWAPSPAWPEGRGVFLLRPMLALRRQALRDWLTARGEAWIEDPANDDLRFARARARARQALVPPPLGEGDHARHGGGAPPPAVGSSRDGRRRSSQGPSVGRHAADSWGIITLSRDAAASTLAAACLCAAGTSRPPRGDRLAGLAARLATAETFTTTLAGARIEAGPESVMVTREPGELVRSGVAPLVLSQGETAVWDGRFEVTASVPGLALLPLDGHARWLPKDERAALKAVPAAARRSLPVASDGNDLWTCPILAVSPFVRAQALVQGRFAAATGEIASEADTQPAAKHGEAAGGVLS